MISIRSTHSEIETNQPCTKSLRKLLRSGLTKNNGTLVQLGRAEKNNLSIETRRKGYSNGVVKIDEKDTSTTSGPERENKKRRRRKHKGRRRDRNKDGRTKKDKHERRKASGKESTFCLKI